MSDSIVITKVVNRVLVSAPGPQGASGGGGATDGNKGDITVSGSGTSWQINAGAVGSAELAANAVTYDKIQATVAARRLLGRPEATAGNVSEVSLGNGLKFDGTSLVVATTDVVSTGTQIIAGTGLTGGTQTLAANVSIGVDFAASGAATAGKAVQATDSRLSDSRTPTTHKTSHATGGTDAIAPADIGAVATTRSVLTGTGLTGGGNLTADRTLSVVYGSTASTACEGNDARLSNARTPTTHKTTHATGGTDAIAPSDIGAVATTRTVTAGTGLTGGGDLSANRTLQVDFAADGVSSLGKPVESTDTRLSNARTPTAHTHGVGDLTATGTPSSTTFLRGDNTWATPAGGSGSVASDTIWAAKGDLAMATGNDAASVLTVGANGTMLVADSAETTGARWGAVEIPTKAFTAGTNNTTTPGLYQTVRYTATTTGITVPSGATFMLVVGAGGGGGGGGGAMNPTFDGAFAGGGGGQGGQGWAGVLRLSDISSPSTVQVTIGAGGAGGNGAATGATAAAGTAGSAGGSSLLETSGGTLIARFAGGAAGTGGGTGAAGVGGSASTHLGWSAGWGGRGGRSTALAYAGGNNYYGGGGGGGGHGSTTNNTITTCGDGGASGYWDGVSPNDVASQTNSQGTARPTTGATDGNPGAAGSGLFGGNGGSGATGNRNLTTGNAGTGGAGGAGGGGGGGGGGRQNYATVDGSRAGNGGAGGAGFVTLRFW